MDPGSCRYLDAVFFVTLYGGRRFERPDFGLKFFKEPKQFEEEEWEHLVI